MAATKCPFKKPYEQRNRIESEAGTKMRNTYGFELSKRGKKELVITGEVNDWEEIQSYRDEVDISVILSKVATGELKPHVDGIYADVSNIPNNIHEAREAMIKIENMWNKLPMDVKAKYDNDIELYIERAGSDAWLIDSGFINKTADEVAPTPEEKTTVDIPSVSTEG